MSECKHGMEYGCTLCTPEVKDCRTGAHNAHPGHDGGRYWTQEEDHYIRTHWETMSDEALAEHFDRSRHSVEHRRTRMGLHRQRHPNH